MFGKKSKEILEWNAELRDKLRCVNNERQLLMEMAVVREKEIQSLMEDNSRLRKELSELRSKLEKGEK